MVSVLVSMVGCEGTSPDPPDPAVAEAVGPSFVGGSRCGECHAEQRGLWSGSHHDRAMQEPVSEAVLGDFDGAVFESDAARAEFFQEGADLFVRTTGSGSGAEDFRVAYTFGVEPLQQYLVEFPGGRLQALPFAWDTRSPDEGGGRWFDLAAGQGLEPGDASHWTGRLQNWNTMCAECHSTGLEKGYDPDSRSYRTTWSELDVSCEACHGPGSKHVSWAESSAESRPEENLGLVVDLSGAGTGEWVRTPGSATAHRVGGEPSRTEAEVCAGCHSRRSTLTSSSAALTDVEAPFSDRFRLALLDEGLYHPDGSMLDEVYVYGSFLQSRMYEAGVTCADCHDPHRPEIDSASADLVCARCHDVEQFASEEHHLHAPGTRGSACVDCHMPSRVYMAIDERHDHAFRVPDPRLSVEIGSPNACNDCHEDRDAEWAASQLEARYGRSERPSRGPATALHAARIGAADLEGRLLETLSDESVPSIFRATALSHLRARLRPEHLPVVGQALADGDPMIRAVAVGSLVPVPPGERLRLAGPALRDPSRRVRHQAVRVLASVPTADFDPSTRAAFELALGEYRVELSAAAEHPEGQIAAASLELGLGRVDRAISAFEEAVRIDPGHEPAYANLADLYRAEGRDDLGEAVIRRGLSAMRASGVEAPGLEHALGLLLVRQNRLPEALESLRRATELDRTNSRYAMVYGVALQTTGDLESAVRVMESAYERAPSDFGLLNALLAACQQAGDHERVALYSQIAREQQMSR